MQNNEIDALHQAAAQAVEAMRNDDNSTLTLGQIMDDGEEAIVCRIEGLNHVDDSEKWSRTLRRAIGGNCRLAIEKNADNTVRYNLVLSKHVEDTRQDSQQQSWADGSGGSSALVAGKPSGERAMFLIVLLGVATALLVAQL